jgi:hypothetical protein
MNPVDTAPGEITTPGSDVRGEATEAGSQKTHHELFAQKADFPRLSHQLFLPTGEIN